MKDKPLTYREVIEKTTEFLTRKGVPSAKCDTEWIVSFLTNKKRMEMYLEFDNFIPHEKVSLIRDMVVKRGNRIPLQHLLGSVEFCDLKLKCDHRALIPRPETERLVEIVTERLKNDFSGKILDLGTGSGAIILALCNKLKYATGVGVDCSSESLSLAEENLTLSGINQRITFDNLDWMKEKEPPGFYDLIISNPPYLSMKEWEHSQPEVKSFDPKLALVSDNNGFKHIQKIAELTPRILKDDGLLCLEIGCGQADQTVTIMQKSFSRIEAQRDLSGVRRYIFCKT